MPKGEATTASTPLQIFSLLWTDDIINILVLESNRQRIALQREKVKPVSFEEMRTFLGITLYMTIVHLPARRMYWSPETRQPTVADAMTCNSFDEIIAILHVNDNELEKQPTAPGYDKLHKVRPLLTALNINFDACAEKETHVSCDEQIIPFKGRSSMKIYMVKKPKKWGYKVWVQAGQSGYVHKFKFAADNLSEEEINQSGTPRQRRAPVADSVSLDPKWKVGVSGEVVLMLVQDQPRNSYVYFDNFFASPDLLAVLKERGLHATCTLRSDRRRNCPLSMEKDLKIKGRGAYEYRMDEETGVLVCQWYDNKVVSVGSNTHGVEPTHEVRRYDGQAKKHINVSCPSLINAYNKNMGGVDKCDMLISLYRNCLKSKKWYKRIIFHMLDMSIVNAWILYRAIKDTQINLCKFKLTVAKALILSKQPREEFVAPRLPLTSLTAKAVNFDQRYDRCDHFVKKMNIKSAQRCKLEGCKRKTLFMCRKCCVYLCTTGITHESDDCFYLFHHK